MIVDSRGRRCPLPVIDLAKAIREVADGEVVTVLADDPAAATDIPAWCRMRGHEYLGTDAADGDRQYRVRKLSG
ncbi:MAG: tRNA 2-thiouridine synthesizing protein [Frankiales bacterium]|nr:tRNA 2-thiouridine synthesizing protein [Frankiales bacterium]MDX6243245.1 tRNA 2-thiouridine synthesizing protein [Frankiales bacterium]